MEEQKKSTRIPRFMKPRDLIILAVLVAAAIIWFILSRQVPAGLQTEAVVHIDHVEVARIPLTPGDPMDYSFPERPSVHFHRYEDGSFAFVESDCPDKVCIKEGRLKQPYHYAACLPNMVVVTIEAVEGQATDPSDLEIDFVY